VNRTYLIGIQGIKDALMCSKSRLRIMLNSKYSDKGTGFEKEIIVSRNKVNMFKYWFDGQE